MLRKNMIPTDEEIIKELKEVSRYKQFLENLYALNEAGREEVMIYLLGILQVQEYRKNV